MSKVLLAESSTIIVEIEKKYLQESGVSIFTASSTEEVMTIARKVKHNLIYLSLGLLSGGDACCAALKSRPGVRHIPVVMVCAQSTEEKQRCRDAGCDGVVTKPVDRREFLENARPYLSAAGDDDRIPCRSSFCALLPKNRFTARSRI